MSKLTVWLNKELETRGWSYNELARRAGLSSGGISIVMTERQNPGWEFCAKVAHALAEPPEYIMRIAGLLPFLPEDKIKENRAVYDLRRMTPDRRGNALAMLHTLANLPKKEK